MDASAGVETRAVRVRMKILWSSPSALASTASHSPVASPNCTDCTAPGIAVGPKPELSLRYTGEAAFWGAHQNVTLTPIEPVSATAKE